MVPEIRVHRGPLDSLSLLPRGLATPGSGVGLKFGVGFGWVKIDLMCRWFFFSFFFLFWL